MGTASSWSVAIFAHNVARTIIDCLDSVVQQSPEPAARIYVLVNGSRDATEQLVNDYSASNPNVTPIRLSLADKANAWNHYVHDIRAEGDVHFFVDGDVTVAPNAFRALSEALLDAPGANAAGALPLTGRDREGWTQRMLALGRLAGGLYALRGRFVSELRDASVRMPTGLIGEDLFLSCLVKGLLSRKGLMLPSRRLVFAKEAGFAFDPLDFKRPRDWVIYGRRLVRYRMRDYQLDMLLRRFERAPLSPPPPDVGALYRQAHELPRYCWRWRITPFDLLAVWRIKRAARKPD